MPNAQLQPTATDHGDDTARPAAVDLLCINTIRTLAMDAVQKAKSGHPGTPMGLAPVAYTLWQSQLRFDPQDPNWPGRDRFVLSVGHASMLLYALLHLAGVKAVGGHQPLGTPAVSLEDIKQFRQLSSKTPGHPEYRMTSGVETTTGPLGQGCGNSVGMALAQRWLAQRYNRPGYPIFDYRIYVLAGDGDMMEGISNEAASVAGHLKLSNLLWVYDSNRITIEGSTDLAFSDDVAARLRALNWHTIDLPDANDTAGFKAALDEAQGVTDRPTLIVVHSHIGFGAPHKQDTREAHGEPLGDEEIRGAKRAYGWPEDAQFLVPDGVYQHFADGIGARGARLHAEWQDMFSRYRGEFPDLARELDQMNLHELPPGWDVDIPTFAADAKGVADLSPSTKSNLTFEGAGSFEADNYGGRNLHFGIREHAMGAICNGMALAGLRAYGSGFLIFSDYMKPPIRLSAIMELPVIYIFTHDSIGVGEDGPTHQPIEQLASLRAIPGMIVLRPCDGNEVAEAWRVAMSLKEQPCCLVLSRQPLPTLDRGTYAPASGLSRGAYVLADTPGGPPQVILMATGSEVSLVVGAHEALAKEGVRSRVVSMPSWDLFEQQSQDYRDSVLPPDITARVAVEQAAVLGWDRYAGARGTVIGMHTFGASAPMAALLGKFGFTPEKVLAAARAQVANAG
jgi:transketolase